MRRRRTRGIAKVIVIISLAVLGGGIVGWLTRPGGDDRSPDAPANAATKTVSAGACCETAPGETPATPESEDPIGALELIDVELFDQHGRRCTLPQVVAGKVVAMNFVFTTCTGICPSLGTNFGELQRILAPQGVDDVQLVSITVDPDVDTPARLKAWSEQFGAQPGWTLLTGAKQDVDALLKSLEVFSADKFDHSPFLLIGNPDRGRWRRVHGLTEPARVADLVLEEVAAANKANDDPPKQLAHAYFPNTPLVAQDGRTLAFYDDLVRDKTVVIHCFFSECQGVCPVMFSACQRIQAELADHLGRDLNLISITVDPDVDTPQHLATFADGLSTQPGWYVLSGTATNLEAILRKLNLYVEQRENHASILIVGNDRTGLWKKLNGLSDHEAIVRHVREVMLDPDASSVRALRDDGHHAAASPPAPTQATATATTQTAVDRGRQVYTRGASPSGHPIEARLGESVTPVAGTFFPCMNCHGRHGEGRPEGGMQPSDIGWTALTAPYETRSATGRRRSPYTADLVRRAVTMGLDSSGRRLDPAMPRYQMSQSDMDDLLAFLEVLETDDDPGVSDSTVRIGVLLPPRDEPRGLHAALRDAMTVYFDGINAEGGVYARRVELEFAVAGGGGGGGGGGALGPSAGAVVDPFADADVLALMACFTGDLDEAWTAAWSGTRIPVVGTLGVREDVSAVPSRWVFHLESGLPGLSRALVGFAREAAGSSGTIAAIVRSDAASRPRLAAHVAAACRAEGWEFETIVAGRSAGDRAATVRRLEADGVDTVFLVDAAANTLALLQEGDSRAWRPSVFLPGPLAGPTLYELPASFDRRVFLAYPTVPADRSPEAQAACETMLSRTGAAPMHRAAQYKAFACASVLTEGLRRCGRRVDRDGLVRALETLRDFPTGLQRPVTFSPNRRVGAPGAYVVTIDLKNRALVPVSGWIAAPTF